MRGDENGVRGRSHTLFMIQVGSGQVALSIFVHAGRYLLLQWSFYAGAPESRFCRYHVSVLRALADECRPGCAGGDAGSSAGENTSGRVRGSGVHKKKRL